MSERMKSWHWDNLDHISKMGLYDTNQNLHLYDLDFLEEQGYIIGEWFGSLKYAPCKMWTITSEGREALKAHKFQVLMATHEQCPAGTCKGEYGTECNLKTDCVKCGHVILRASIF